MSYETKILDTPALPPYITIHFLTICGGITPTLEKNFRYICHLQDLLKQVEIIVNMTQVAQQPHTNQHKVNIAYNLLQKTGVLKDNFKVW